MTKRKRLTIQDHKIVNGPRLGDPVDEETLSRLFPIRAAIQNADKTDEVRRRDYPTREELAEAFAQGTLTAEQKMQIIDILLDCSPGQEGRPKDDQNAKLARDLAIYSEYAKHLGKAQHLTTTKKLHGGRTPREIAIENAGKVYGLDFKSAEAAITRAKKILFKA